MIETTRSMAAARLNGPSGTDASAVLRLLLEEGRYALAVTMTRRFPLDSPFPEPLSDYRLEDALTDFPALTRMLTRLFALGCVVSDPDLRRTIGEDAADLLEDAGILEQAEGGWRARWLVATFLNRYFLASAPFWMRPYRPEEGIAYIGPESFWFARFIANHGPFEEALDLGTGTGLLASLVDARSVTAMELDPTSAAMARFNIRLNGLENRVELVEGDLFQPLDRRRYELVVSNPPFIPSPQPIAMPLCGAGGSHGEAVLRRLLLGLDSHLTAAGQAVLYGESFGGADEPFIASWLRERGPERLGFSLYVRSSQTTEAVGLRLTTLWQEVGCPEADAWRAWNRLIGETAATYHYSYLIWANPGIRRVTVHHPYRV